MTSHLTSIEKEKLISELHLNAILGTIPELALCSPESKALIKDWDFSLCFQVLGESGITLNFANQKVTSSTHSTSSNPCIKLLFFSPSQLNNLFMNRGLAVPLPIQGLFHLSKALQFNQLADLLRHHLEPTSKDLENSDFLANHVRLTLSVALRGLSAISSHDPTARHYASKLPNGIAQFRIAEQNYALRVQIQKGTITLTENWNETPEVEVEFRTNRIAYQALSNQLDSMAALGLGDIQIRGSVPMAEGLELVMQQIQPYLQPNPTQTN